MFEHSGGGRGLRAKGSHGKDLVDNRVIAKKQQTRKPWFSQGFPGPFDWQMIWTRPYH
jgi:hypothetical protein